MLLVLVVGGVAALAGSRQGSGPASVPQPRALTVPDTAGSATATPTAVAGVRMLVPSTAQPPAAAPDGAALPGGAPAPRGDRTHVAADSTPFRPTGLILPSGTKARVLPAGVLGDGSFAVPQLPSDVGWWTGGALAGEPFGNLVLSGHVDSRRFGVGALARMKTVRPGQVLTVTAPGRTMRYRVISTLQVPKARLTATSEYFAQDGPHRLVVITCGGPFDRERHSYQDNLIVVARPVS